MKENILDYEKLVYSMIRKYSYSINDIDDLYQVGMIALQKAQENYKDNFNSKFSTYACLYIKGELLKYIRENRVMKINKDLIKINSLISKAKEVLSQKLLKEPSLEEISMFLELPIDTVMDANMAGEYVKSLDYELNEEGKELNLYDSVSYCEKGYNEDIIDLRTEINNLSDFERKIIDLRYYEDKSQQETSKILGMSQVQVSRKENKVLTKLKDRLVV